MTKYRALVKMLLVQQLRRVSHSVKGKKRGGTIAACILLAVCFAPLLVGMFVLMLAVGGMAGRDANVLSMLLLCCQGAVFLLGSLTSVASIFDSRDSDRLLYLPIRSITAFWARFTVVYLGELIVSAACMVCVIVPYGIGALATLHFWALLPLIFLLIPLFPTLLGVIVTVPVSALFASLKANPVVKNALRIALYVVFMIVYVAVFMSFGLSSDSSDTSQNDIAHVVEFLSSAGEKTKFCHWNYTLATAATASLFTAWAAGTALCLAENAAIFAVASLLALAFYRRIISSSTEGSPSAEGKKVVYGGGSVLRQLISCDFKRVLRDKQLSFQSFGGLLAIPFVLVFMFIALSANVGEEGQTILALLVQQPLYQGVAPVVLLAYMALMGVGTNVLGIYPITRENYAVALLKTYPVPFEKILLAKVILASAVMLVSDLVICVLCVALLAIKWYYGIAMLVALLFLSFGSMCVTTLLDVKNPDIGWTTFAKTSHQGIAAMKAMLVSALCMSGLGAVSSGFIVWFALTQSPLPLLLMWTAVIGFSVAFAAVAYRIMSQKAQYYFERIEA